jgi:hypothetical protein
MNIENNKYLFGIVIALMLCGFFWVINTDENESFEKVIKVIEKDEYNGIVTEKFIDNQNHNNPTIILSNKRKITLYGQQYDEINVGDSLSKKINSGILEVFKKDTVIRIDQRKHIETLKPKNRKK